MNNKAMGIGQVFIFIVAAITFAAIMLFGYKAISSFINDAEEVEFVQFKTDLESSIKRIYTSYGSVRTELFRLPPKYEKICFVDLDADPDDPLNQGLEGEDQAAYTVWQDAFIGWTDEDNIEIKGYEAADQNVFLQPQGLKIQVYKIKMRDGSGYLCENITNGKFSLILEGKGSYTELAKVS